MKMEEALKKRKIIIEVIRDGHSPPYPPARNEQVSTIYLPISRSNIKANLQE